MISRFQHNLNVFISTLSSIFGCVSNSQHQLYSLRTDKYRTFIRKLLSQLYLMLLLLINSTMALTHLPHFMASIWHCLTVFIAFTILKDEFLKSSNWFGLIHAQSNESNISVDWFWILPSIDTATQKQKKFERNIHGI